MALIHAVSRVIKVTPVLDTSIYASGDRLGSVMTIPNAVDFGRGSAMLSSICLVDQAKQSVAIDFMFFNGSSASPVGAPTIASADNAAIDITDAIMSNCCHGVVSVLASDYATLANSSVATKTNINLLLHSSAGERNIYCLMVCRSGTPTYTASDLVVRYGFLVD